MITTYNVTGMTCNGCTAKVKQLLEQLPGIHQATINLDTAEASVSSDAAIETLLLRNALSAYPKYTLTEKEPTMHQHMPAEAEPEAATSGLQVYKPIWILFSYILGISLLERLSAIRFIGKDG